MSLPGYTPENVTFYVRRLNVPNFVLKNEQVSKTHAFILWLQWSESIKNKTFIQHSISNKISFKIINQPQGVNRWSYYIPLADNLDSVCLPSLLVCAASTDGEAALSQSTVFQVHLITHIKRWVLHRKTVNWKKVSGHIYSNSMIPKLFSVWPTKYQLQSDTVCTNL